MSLMDLLLGRKHVPMIGLDISSSSAKLVELGMSATGEYVLERLASEPFEKGWITDGQIEKFDEVAEAFIREAGALPSFKGYRQTGTPPFPATICASLKCARRSA